MILQAVNISKSFGNKVVLSKVDFSLEKGRTISILGKSGCGKSTLLKILAGIETADTGQILLNGKDVSTVPTKNRHIVYLFQEALLFPHLSVFDNLAFGLKIKKEKKAAIRQKVKELAHKLGIEGHLEKKPDQLSGGQKQRVAFGRAIIINPPLILLDEPFSSLDVETRSTMQALYKKIAAEYQITALFVTHDLKEAIIMGDSLAYMDKGILDVYKNPTDFIRDEKTGVSNEIAFWNNLNN